MKKEMFNNQNIIRDKIKDVSFKVNHATSDRQSFHKLVIFKVKVLLQRNRKTKKCVIFDFLMVRHSVLDRKMKVKSEMFRLSVAKTDRQTEELNVKWSETERKTERQTDREKFIRKSKLSCLCMQRKAFVKCAIVSVKKLFTFKNTKKIKNRTI